METVQQSSTWFSKQGLFVKVAIGCSGLFVLCCLCSIPIAIFSSSISAPPEVSDTSVAEIEPSPIVAQTEKPTEVPTIVLTNTPKPTNTHLPSTTTPTAIVSLVDVYSILGESVNEVEAILGSTILITPNDDNDDNLFGGEHRDYELGKYSFSVAYDKNGIARVFQVMDGLSDENYSLTQWKQILPQFGVYINTPPERTAPLAVYWDNYNGYFIAVAGDPVWTVQIAEAEYHP